MSFVVFLATNVAKKPKMTKIVFPCIKCLPYARVWSKKVWKWFEKSGTDSPSAPPPEKCYDLTQNVS